LSEHGLSDADELSDLLEDCKSLLVKYKLDTNKFNQHIKTLDGLFDTA
jgi:hypothetical protein